MNKNCSDNLKINFETQVRYSKDVILDLQIEISDGEKTEYIVVENKLKLYPTTEQLIKYQDCFKGKKATFILLSLASNLKLPEDWTYISYANLAESLSKITDFKNSYDEFLIKDYVTVINILLNAFPKSSTEMYDFYEPNELDKIGLKDIYVKYRTAELKNTICEYTGFSSDTVTTDFRDKQGILNIWKVFENYDINFLIQIQKNEYRYCMIYGKTNENDLREKIAIELAESNLWFTNCISKYPKAQNYKSKNFCGYKPNFIYKYQTLENIFKKNLSEITYKEIAEQISNDIANLTNNKHKIIQIIAKNI